MFKVHILGTSSATPAFHRHPSAQVVSYNDRYYLIDCGEGTQMQLQKYRIKFSRLDAIFISHLHGDHILGIPGLLSTLNIFERTRPLPIYAPAGLKGIIETVFALSETYLRYELQFHPLEETEVGSVLFENDRLQITTLPLNHRTFCRGFLFKEINKRRKFNFFKAKEAEIPNEYFHLIKQETDVTLLDGRTLRADDFLFPADPTLSYAYCSDTAYNEELLPYLEGIQVLYHEATFLENLKKRAKETQHSTALEAATIAQKAKVKLLIIGHYSARYKDLHPLLEEASSVFEQTSLAIEGKVYDLKEFI